jgi:hypothetical protein
MAGRDSVEPKLDFPGTITARQSLALPFPAFSGALQWRHLNMRHYVSSCGSPRLWNWDKMAYENSALSLFAILHAFPISISDFRFLLSVFSPPIQANRA